MSQEQLREEHFDIKAESESPATTIAETPSTEIKIEDKKSKRNIKRSANPEEYLLTSLAGCINRIAHISAYEKYIKLENMKLDVQAKVNKTGFKNKDSEKKPRFEQINVKINAQTNAKKQQKEEWLQQIKQRSQIKNTIQTNVQIQFTETNKADKSPNTEYGKENKNQISTKNI